MISHEELTLLQQLNDAVAVLSQSFAFEYVNPSFLRLIQVPAFKTIADLSFYDFIATPEDQEVVKEMQTTSLREISFLTKNKEPVPVELSLSPRIDRDGKLYGYVAVLRNIALRIIERDRLTKALERYRAISNSGFDWLWEVDPSGKFTYVSPSVYKTTGYKPEELFGNTLFDFMTATEALKILSSFRRISIKNENFANLENVALSKNGDEIIFSTTGIPIFDEDGKLKGYRGGNRDITNEVRTADSLKKALSTTRKILENLPVGVVIIDRNRRIRQINSRACDVTGWKIGELTGQICHSVFCPALVNRCPILDLNQAVDRAERFILHRDGRKIPVLKSVIPVELNSEDLLLEVFIDLSEVKSLEKRTTAENEKLRSELSILKASREKNIHERHGGRPRHGKLLSGKIAALSGIAGLVDILTEMDQSPGSMKILKTVQNHCVKLTAAVHALQDSMGMSGDYSLEVCEFLIEKLLNKRLLDYYRSMGSETEISISIDSSLPARFFGPALGIESVLRFVLDYAIRRSFNDTIEICASYEFSTETSMQVKFSVSFPASQFQYKKQSQQLDSQNEHWDSRGMTSCRKFVQAAGGEFHLQTNRDSGSVVWLSLPLEKAANQEESNATKISGLHVLVMEGNSGSLSLHKKMLESMGCRVTAVSDQAEVLIKLREAVETKTPVQISLLDGDSDEMNGLVTARLIRQDKRVGSRNRLLVFTSKMKTGDIDSCQAEGCSALLRKPLNLNTLRDCILRILATSEAGSPIITDYALH